MSILSRRRLFGYAGVAGAATLGLPALVAAEISAGSPAGAATTATSTCVLTSAGEEGPFWVDERLNRSDVRGGQAGVPLTFTLNVLGNGCAGPVAGATVEIWSASAQGVYSDESSESSVGETWLRGYQVTDSSGRVTFTTVYPGWYSGRTEHIHVRFRVGSLNVTTQIMFDEATTAKVLATSAYRRGSARDTTNGNDRVYGEEAADHGVFQLALTGDTTSGFTGALTAVIDAAASSATVTASATAPASPSASAGTTTTGSLMVGSTLSAVRVSALSAKRHKVQLTLRNAHTVKVDARLYKGASMRYRALSTEAAGVKTVTLTVPAHVQGTLTLAVLLSDGAGRTAKLTRSVALTS